MTSTGKPPSGWPSPGACSAAGSARESLGSGIPGPPAPPRYEDVWSFEPLLRAFQAARRAKRGRGGEPAFYRELESNLLALSEALRDRAWRPDPYRFFRLWNKKERVVSEASFRDRVVHHALVAALEPWFEARFIRHSYACRKGRGQHAAVRAARRLVRVFPFFLRMDVRHYFDGIDHQVLLAMLGAAGLDNGTLWLSRTLLAGAEVPGCPAGRGLPIGNLTSQFWANVYLDGIDHSVRDLLGMGAYLRYMDDILVFAHRKEALWDVVAEVTRCCREDLHLEVKATATRVAPVREGVPWLGFLVYPSGVRPDASTRRRFQRKLAASVRRAAAFPLAEDTEFARASSLCEHLRAMGSTVALRRTTLDRLDARRGPA